jgi:hypothetical protein
MALRAIGTTHAEVATIMGMQGPDGSKYHQRRILAHFSMCSDGRDVKNEQDVLRELGLSGQLELLLRDFGLLTDI